MLVCIAIAHACAKCECVCVCAGVCGCVCVCLSSGPQLVRGILPRNFCIKVALVKSLRSPSRFDFAGSLKVFDPALAPGKFPYTVALVTC